MSKLRPYQERDYNSILDFWEKQNINNVLYQLPTGGGKSVIIEHLVLNYKKEKILILAHKRELIFQMKNRLEKNGLKVGIIIGNIEENLDSNIIVASIRTVTREKRLDTILNKGFEKIIIDEAHHIRTSSYENVLDNYIKSHPNLKLLGVTATPYRRDKKSLDKYFNSLITSDSIQLLQEQGYLAKYKVFYTPVKNISEEVDENSNDYQITSLSNYMNKPEILQYLVNSYKKHGENRQMIIFCVDKKHAKSVKDIYIKNGFVNINHIDSDTPTKKRDEILKDFANNKLQIITCIETLTEGVDLPETKCIQLARPTRSLVLYLQMVGRGGRPKQDGSECVVLDCAGCSQEHNLPNSPREWSLNPLVNPSNPGKKHKILGKRRDGTLTDDEDELEFLELVEVNEDDYFLNIENGIEKSKEENKKIDIKCVDLLYEIGNFIINKFPELTQQKIDYEYYNKNKVELIFKNEYFYIEYNTLEKTEYFLIQPSTMYSSIYKNEDIKKYYDKCILLGNMNMELIKPKNQTFILEKFRKIQELQDLKIDINKLYSLKGEFEIKQKRTKLEQHLIKNNIITITDGNKYLRSYFRDCWGWDTIKKMIFEKNKLLSNNTITFLLSDKSQKVIKNVKPEKVLDILNNITWE